VSAGVRTRASSTAFSELKASGGTPLAPPPVPDVEVTGEQLRFDVASSGGGNVGAVEIDVYGQLLRPARW
jgi:hypothetical protein